MFYKRKKGKNTQVMIVQLDVWLINLLCYQLSQHLWNDRVCFRFSKLIPRISVGYFPTPLQGRKLNLCLMVKWHFFPTLCRIQFLLNAPIPWKLSEIKPNSRSWRQWEKEVFKYSRQLADMRTVRIRDRPSVFLPLFGLLL